MVCDQRSHAPDAGAPARRRRERRGDRRSDPVAEPRQQRRQGGQRGQHRGQDGERGRDREAVEEADAEQQLTEQRQDHRRAGEQDSPARGVHRDGDGGVDGIAALAVLAKAGDDEQRIVDPDPQTDHGGQLGGEIGDLDDVRSQAGETDADPEAEQGGHDRQAHRDKRPEGDQQHDDRGEQSDRGRRTERWLLGMLDRLATERDLQRRGARGPRGRDHAVDSGDGKRPGLLVKGHGRERHTVIGGDLVRPLSRVGADHRDDMRQLRHAGQRSLDPRLSPPGR